MLPSEFAHHMLKEIFEEPTVVRKTTEGEVERTRQVAQEIKSKGYEIVYITGSGTSYHAGMASQYALSNLTDLMTSIIPASEFQRWVPARFQKKVLLMAISQSGESLDVLEAVEVALKRNMDVLAVTNTAGSSLARKSKYLIRPRSHREVAIPATKTYVTQLASIFMLSVELAHPPTATEEIIYLKEGLNKAPLLLEQTLRSLGTQIRDLAKSHLRKNFIFLLGSGPNYATALEAALKLKETCTIFAEGFAAREFLHGPLRLVDERTLVVLIASPDEIDVCLGLSKSLRSFGAPVIFVSESSPNSARLSEYSDDVILVPAGLPKVFSPMLYIVPLQLFAYYSSVFRGLNPDKPEKLTKVVK